MEDIKVSRLSAGSVFRYGFSANAALIMPIMIVVGVLGMSGGTTVSLNGHQVYGVQALITPIVMGLVVSALLAVWLMLGTLLLRLLKGRAPSLAIGD